MSAISAQREYDPARPYWLYRYFDENRVLLYVGIARDVDKRLGDHLADDWHRYIKYMQAETCYPTRSEAHAAERLAIKSEQPLFNGTHTTMEAVLASIDYLEARGADSIFCQRRLYWRWRGNGYVKDATVREAVAAYRRDGTIPGRFGVIRIG